MVVMDRPSDEDGDLLRRSTTQGVEVRGVALAVVGRRCKREGEKLAALKSQIKRGQMVQE